MRLQLLGLGLGLLGLRRRRLGLQLGLLGQLQGRMLENSLGRQRLLEPLLRTQRLGRNLRLWLGREQIQKPLRLLGQLVPGEGERRGPKSLDGRRLHGSQGWV